MAGKDGKFKLDVESRFGNLHGVGGIRTKFDCFSGLSNAPGNQTYLMFTKGIDCWVSFIILLLNGPLCFAFSMTRSIILFFFIKAVWARIHIPIDMGSFAVGVN